MSVSPQVKLKPGDTIGILGGGQLGRMLSCSDSSARPAPLLR